MIGVVAQEGQRASVAEFFELFKTPWEFVRPNRKYDVVLVTAGEIPEANTRLLVVFGSELLVGDTHRGVHKESQVRGGLLHHQNLRLPVYGNMLIFAQSSSGKACLLSNAGITGLKVESAGQTLIRAGFDLFSEIQFLLSTGQPVQHAATPTLDVHIQILRGWILDAGVPLFEIPPVPAGHKFFACLTHDIDFIGIRRHKFDHTMWGFLFRATVVALWSFLRGRIPLLRLLANWRAAAALPFVYLGWAQDFWEPFEWYLQVEAKLPATYFLIPFKNHAGWHVSAPHSAWRAARYDIGDIPERARALEKAGCEIGVHGIDSWHSVEKGRAERGRVAGVTGSPEVGIRMHWLLQDEKTWGVLEKSGYAYDSTCGYNETVGYRNGTTQAYRPLNAQTLLELPMHIQDGALFFPERLNLSEAEAWRRCSEIMDQAQTLGGVVTLLWHCRSHAPERFWGDFYVKLIHALKSTEACFVTAAQAVAWFRKRREACFEQVRGADGNTQLRLRYQGDAGPPAALIRIHVPALRTAEGNHGNHARSIQVDIPWTDGGVVELDAMLHEIASLPHQPEGVQR